MPINGEKFERGEYVEHATGAMYRYEGRVNRSAMWGLGPSQNRAEEAWHVISPKGSDSLYLEPDSVFRVNYREPGTWTEPARGQDWTHKGMTRTVRVRKVVDDLVIYDYEDEAGPVHYARTVDEFVKEFRHGVR